MKYWMLTAVNRLESIRLLPEQVSGHSSRTAFMAGLQSREERAGIVGKWATPGMRILSRRDSVVRGRYAAFAVNVFPGASMVVRSDLADRINSVAGADVALLPLEVNGQHGTHYLLWLLNVIDCLDEGQSDLFVQGKDSVHVSRYRFKVDLLSTEIGFFRLPRRFHTSGDWVSHPVREAISESDFSGFTYWDRS